MNLPHQYSASATAQTQDNVTLSVEHAPSIASDAPREFGGPGDKWSPEDLMVAAIADCFVLSFRAIAAMSKFDWIDLRCEVAGTLDKVDRAIQFTGFDVHATLTVPSGADENRAKRLLEKAEAACFITNTLKVNPHLHADVVVQ